MYTINSLGLLYMQDCWEKKQMKLFSLFLCCEYTFNIPQVQFVKYRPEKLCQQGGGRYRGEDGWWCVSLVWSGRTWRSGCLVSDTLWRWSTPFCSQSGVQKDARGQKHFRYCCSTQDSWERHKQLRKCVGNDLSECGRAGLVVVVVTLMNSLINDDNYVIGH